MENCLMLFSCRAAMRRMLFLQIHLTWVGRDFLDDLDVPGEPAGAGSFFGCREVRVRISGEALKNVPCFWVGAGWAPGPGAASSSEWGLMKTNDLGRLKG